MRHEVWVIYRPQIGCMCWMDAICPHGLTWQPNGPACIHEDDILGDVHESLADAVRSLFSIDGRKRIGSLIRERFHDGSHRTMTVYVMPPGGPWSCDHEDNRGWPAPFRIIERKYVEPRSFPGDEMRQFAAEYP